MITYRDVTREEEFEDKLAYLEALVRLGEAEGALVEAGELEQGVLDSLHPRRDAWDAVAEELRELTCAAAAAYRARRLGRPAEEPLARAARVLARLGRREVRVPLRIRVPEGYVHYALDPLAYSGAAARYAAQVGGGRAARAVVVGVRSIGTGLSGAVATELGASRSFTVRPRGESGARRVEAAPSLEETARGWLAAGGDALIVDEGPGATGETFSCVAGWLRRLGVSPGRIVLLPSHGGAPPLAPEERLRWFATVRTFAPECSDGRVEAICRRLGLEAPRDLSAGRWREVVPGARDAAACPHHERLKYLARDSRGAAWLIRYCALGRSGAETASRAARLHSLGHGPEVLALEDGFLISRWVEGGALAPAETGSPAFGAALAAYLSVRADLFGVGGPAPVEPMAGLLRQNAAEALGESVPGLGAAIRRLEALPPRPAGIPDGRPQPREWVRSPAGYRKTDALDHGNGLRFPGPTDAAWDVAAAVVEHGLDDGAADALTALCAPRDPRGLARAVEAYRCVVAAAALGEAFLSARETGAEEQRRRLEAEADRYRSLLGRELRRQDALAG